MALKFACKDMGQKTCPFEATAATPDELMAKIAGHVKEVHGLTDAQLQDPKMIAKFKAVFKKA